jgi:S1-C subfamily serine protease
VFDIDGSLLAVILPCGGRLAAIATSSIAEILKESDTSEQRLLARYGLVLDALADDEAAYFKIDSGVVVREVWTGYRGDEAGVMAGDVIDALNGAVVATPGDLSALTGPSGGQALALRVRRGSKTLTISLSGDDASPVPDTRATHGAGLVWESPPKPYRIDTVIPGSRAAMAGIEPGDRLVRIDHAEPRNLAQVQRIFADGKALPVLLEIERDDRRLAILVR